MRLRVRLIGGLLLAGGLGAGCAAKAAPLLPTGLPGLDAPEPPVRLVVPTPPPAELPPVDEPPATTAPKPARGAQTPLPVTRTVVPPPPADPPAEPPPTTTPPAVLSTSADTAEFEKRVKRVRDQLTLAQADLARVSRKTLGADARAQYDAALGFIRQAESALRVKNLIYAGQLADKAATMAALLRRLGHP